MILATHAVIGGALGSLTANPLAAVAVGACTHYLLDAIPHWEYSLKALSQKSVDPLATSLHFDSNPGSDFRKLAIDFGLAFLLVMGLNLIGLGSPLLWWGAAGGMLPDGLQFFYYRYHWFWLKPFQRFHLFMHAETSLKTRPLLGILAQVSLAGVIIWCSILLI